MSQLFPEFLSDIFGADYFPPSQSFTTTAGSIRTVVAGL